MTNRTNATGTEDAADCPSSELRSELKTVTPSSIGDFSSQLIRAQLEKPEIFRALRAELRDLKSSASITTSDVGSNHPTRRLHSVSSNSNAANLAGLDLIGQRLCDYLILGEIARGGMGIVYKAKHTKLNRLVAIKVMLAGQLASQEDVIRFHTEAQATANLEHPGIVPIYEIGEKDGIHFFAMAFVEGESLADRIRREPLSPKKAAEFLLKVADAIAYAHEQGVIHRDLKPANILVDQNDEPKVTDFGLARRFQTDANQTQTGTILGTPSYMPPEQAVGNVRYIDERSDVYALGAILYTMLTGRPPFQGKNCMEVLIQVIEKIPNRPRGINPKIPSDLDLICMKCLEKDGDNRYASCQALCQDLNSFLNGEAISISSPNWTSKISQLVQRNRDDVHLHAFGDILLWFATIILCTEIGLQCIPRSSGFTSFLTVRLIQFAMFGLVLVAYRKQLKTHNPAISQWISVSVAFIVAANAEVFATIFQHSKLYGNEVVHQYDCYPSLLILSGLFMAALGRQYWGMCYVFSLVFCALAIVAPMLVLWEPTIFGVAWFLTLVTIGVRLRKIGKQVADT